MKKLNSFASGLKVPFSGVTFIKEHPELLKYCIIPVIINFIITVLLVVGAVYLSSSLSDLIPDIYPDKWWWKGLMILVFIVSLGLCFFIIISLFSIILEILTIPFADYLSERVERILFHTRELPGIIRRSFLKQVLFSLSLAFKKLLLMLFNNLKYFLWNLVPVAGSILFFVFSTKNQLQVLGMEFFEPSLERRITRFSQRKEFIKNNRLLIYGAGTIQLIMLMIPVLKIIFNPFGTVGATILYVRLYQKHAS